MIARPDYSQLPEGVTERLLVDYYRRCRSVGKVATALGMARGHVSRVLRRNGVYLCRNGGRDDDRSYLPTPEQIREACEEIQRGWSEEEKARRAILGPVPWSLPDMNEMMKLCPTVPRNDAISEVRY